MQEELFPENYPTLIYYVEDFLVKLSALLEKDRDLKDTRGTLFFEIARILSIKRPKYILLENVKHLLSHDNFRTITTIFRVLTDLDYSIEWQVLNSKYFGVPQNRERIFIFGTRNGSTGKIFPIIQSDKTSIKRISEKQVALPLQSPGNQAGVYRGMNLISNSALNRKWEIRKDNILPPLRANHDAGNNDLIQIGIVGKDSEATRIYDPNGIARTIKNGGGMGAKTGLYAIGYTRDKSGKKRKNHLNKESFGTVKQQSGNQEQYVLENSKIRRLTPVECERLQGFPDEWTKYGIDDHGKKIKISDSQRYKMTGNAVTVNVIKAIAERINQRNLPIIKE